MSLSKQGDPFCYNSVFYFNKDTLNVDKRTSKYYCGNYFTLANTVAQALSSR